ncbi:hypothetical protein Ahy_B01g056254 isoform G [Arachis hypogaea]|uniref:Uncharacterized protein n=1 Tax=Arachis hypogaea TaxID=3818 RepID=A0A445AYF6_ARAHY|nr:hypothetical protein Ahy_B01g056254 isoform G [Arachis hypogaea]
MANLKSIEINYEEEEEGKVISSQKPDLTRKIEEERVRVALAKRGENTTHKDKRSTKP